MAVVGVLGTLLSAVLTQRAADRTRQRELEYADRQRAKELEAQERRAAVEMRREAYVVLNTAARQYAAALTDMMHALLKPVGTDDASHRLTEARDAHRDCYAEAQLRVPDPILDLAQGVNRSLNTTYGMLKRLDNGDLRPGDSLDEVRAAIDRIRGELQLMRRQMRIDLGVSSAAGPGNED
ncbi:hypothetical protein [Streptomyces sp. XD-27]|uniref:hypothetical protein n=1 Tax=Streptomyces sp. XD-27 TaxID=3062779 RepID=UPI0026F4277C|nr:hypothetical protein [Streptomyces sp. XD-27]WKX69542.1 hypothetical protein Q3Y56_06110 [Streptomyces sp. XD-27]